MLARCMTIVVLVLGSVVSWHYASSVYALWCTGTGQCGEVALCQLGVCPVVYWYWVVWYVGAMLVGYYGLCCTVAAWCGEVALCKEQDGHFGFLETRQKVYLGSLDDDYWTATIG